MQAGPPGRHRLGAHLHPPASAEPGPAAGPVHPGQDRGHVQQRQLMQLIQVDCQQQILLILSLLRQIFFGTNK